MPLIPINTDAPLYHFPCATIGLMLVNIICFVATGSGMNDRLQEPWLLQYGDGLNPLEWIPAAFAHGGFVHLIGNMDHYPEDNAWARIRMAELLLTQFKRPTASLLTLKGVSLAGVNEQMQTLAKKIVRTANEQVRSGVQDEEPEW